MRVGGMSVAEHRCALTHMRGDVVPSAACVATMCCVVMSAGHQGHAAEMPSPIPPPPRTSPPRTRALRRHSTSPTRRSPAVDQRFIYEQLATIGAAPAHQRVNADPAAVWVESGIPRSRHPHEAGSGCTSPERTRMRDATQSLDVGASGASVVATRNPTAAASPRPRSAGYASPCRRKKCQGRLGCVCDPYADTGSPVQMNGVTMQWGTPARVAGTHARKQALVNAQHHTVTCL